ncbi:hypothetical protein SARC_09121 [Sphaeroforma arctica JP610]|uniref:Uncharacterized protein n=1 Tax=Sphaeroforma arctica JP610 TaxID=667725 RepID=A0A0L0FPK7_9EUKA|nr:hypothetical protein SARC_09121 [Sphaeroforma arctica JP610]KNC78446.1 hypothetical protein SARC_09121 [Sphaeroforma arctica JP610]|eukprot:XP_014152348.1 hypothetical protein SARC_09121 [Sphaeroforma arctica JP610]
MYASLKELRIALRASITTAYTAELNEDIFQAFDMYGKLRQQHIQLELPLPAADLVNYPSAVPATLVTEIRETAAILAVANHNAITALLELLSVSLLFTITYNHYRASDKHPVASSFPYVPEQLTKISLPCDYRPQNEKFLNEYDFRQLDRHITILTQQASSSEIQI